MMIVLMRVARGSLNERERSKYREESVRNARNERARLLFLRVHHDEGLPDRAKTSDRMSERTTKLRILTDDEYCHDFDFSKQNSKDTPA